MALRPTTRPLRRTPRGDRYDEDAAPRGYDTGGGGYVRNDGVYDAGSRGGDDHPDALESEMLYVGSLNYQVGTLP